MSILNNSLLLGAAAGGYTISRSLRFNSADSAYLSRTPASAGNRKTWTWAGWVKRSGLGTAQGIFGSISNDASSQLFFEFNPSGSIVVYDSNVSGGIARATAAVHRDASAWYHVVLTYDTTQATANNRVRLYVNGAEVTAFTFLFNPNQNSDGRVNTATEHSIASWNPYVPSFYFSGYLADIHFIDGQALTPTSFGEFSATTGVWMPKRYAGTYGSQGWKLDFSDNSAATATTLGKDSSGNGNNWTPNNLSVTNGFTATFNPLPLNNPNEAFDGNTGTYAYGPSATTISFNPPLTATANRLDLHARPGWTWTASTNLGTVTVADTGSAWPSGGSYPGWYSYANASLTTIYSISVSAAANWTIQGVQIAGSPAVVGTQLLVQGAGVNDSLVDVPTNGSEVDTGLGGQVRGNYCTWNPLDKNTSDVIKNGNLDVELTGYRSLVGTFAVASGKWYWEVTQTGTSSAAASLMIGVADASASSASKTWQGANGWFYYTNGNKYNNNANTSYGSSFATNDVIGIALDMDAGAVVFYKNGTSQGTAFSGFSGKLIQPALSEGTLIYFQYASANFGQRPFAYTAPSGFKALCTANLPGPTIVKPSTVMDVKLYTGNDSTQTISGLGFSPDLVWTKCRSFGLSHIWMDTLRGTGVYLRSNSIGADEPNTNVITSFNSDGFTLGSSSASNLSPETYAAWCWDAGSSTVTNTAGSISSQVRANASAGFSIVKYNGTSANATIGHGLGIAPQLIIRKYTNDTDDWYTYHVSAGTNKYFSLNRTTEALTSTSIWQNTAPTSSIFYIGGGNNNSNSIAYCFAPVAGYSSFGSYTGNGSSLFVYLGFRPRFILFKRTDTASNWVTWDTARDTYNVVSNYLLPNTAGAEASVALGDFVSNGFTLQGVSSALNTSGGTYIYAAFAEAPFQYARAR